MSDFELERELRAAEAHVATLQANEAALHARLQRLLSWAGEPVAGSVGCGMVPGCDRPGRYWLLPGFRASRVYDEEGFVHAFAHGHDWRHVMVQPE